MYVNAIIIPTVSAVQLLLDRSPVHHTSLEYLETTHAHINTAGKLNMNYIRRIKTTQLLFNVQFQFPLNNINCDGWHCHPVFNRSHTVPASFSLWSRTKYLHIPCLKRSHVNRAEVSPFPSGDCVVAMSTLLCCHWFYVSCNGK